MPDACCASGYFLFCACQSVLAVISHSGTVNVGHSLPQSEVEAARQRMHDSGIEYSRDRYYEGLQQHDAEVISLFTKAGMTISPGDFQPFVQSLFDGKVADAILQIDQSKGCPTDSGMGHIYGSLEGAPLDFARKACAKPSVLAQLRMTISGAQAQLRVAQESDAANRLHRAKDIDSCAATMQHTFGSRVTAATAKEQCTMNVLTTEEFTPRAQEMVTTLEKSFAALNGSAGGRVF